MKTMLTTVALTGILMLALTAGASAETIWSGEATPASAGYACVHPGNEGTFSYTTDPDIMLQDNSGNKVAYWMQDFRDPGDEMLRASGWFIETRLEVLRSPGDWAVYVGASDDAGWTYLNFTPTSLNLLGESESYALTTGYHTVRVEMAAVGTSFDVYVDDMTTIALSTAGQAYNAGINTGFGNASGSAGGKANWDYFNVHAIPEPTSLVLLAGALMSLFVWRRR